MTRKLFALALGCVLCLTLPAPAFASERTEQDLAAAFVRDQGIMIGNGSGNLNLDTVLTRVELAVLLTRLKGGETELRANTAYYERGCGFIDVPQWARPYVGYCVRGNLVVGYDRLHYGANDPVTPSQACTVILRAHGEMGSEGSVWSYSTACDYAARLGLIDQTTAQAPTIKRGDMAVLIYRMLTGARFADTPTVGEGDGYLANGMPVTEENVLELLHEIEQGWPSGTVWGAKSTPGTHWNDAHSTAANRVMDHYWVNAKYGCGGYAAMVSSLIFGDTANPARPVEDLSQIRPGDILILIRNSGGKVWHVMVALESPNAMNALHYTDGNHGSLVYWPGYYSQYSRENLNCYDGKDKAYRVEAWTRYPGSVPYTGRSVNAWDIPASGKTQ